MWGRCLIRSIPTAPGTCAHASVSLDTRDLSMRKTFSIFHFHCLFAAFLDFFSALLSKKARMGIFLLSHPGWGRAGEQGKGWWFLVFSWGF